MIDDASAALDRHWAQLADGGLVLMELGEYPFSSHYGWVQDRFGVSWQISPANVFELMGYGDPERFKRNFAAMMQMKKLDISKFD